jgi:hypothetical protein
MVWKRILGYIFIVVAILLALLIVARIFSLIGAVFAFLKIFTGNLDSYQMGYAVGVLLLWGIHIALTVFFRGIGRRWIKKPVADEMGAGGRKLNES